MENTIKDDKNDFQSEEVTGHKEEESQSSMVQAEVLEKIVGVLDYLLRCRQQTVSISQLVGNYAELHGEELSPEGLGFHSTEDLMFYLSHHKKWITPVGASRFS